jgi:hypothetical protein
VHTLPELIAYAKANPGKLSYGSAGSGTMTHLTGELFKMLSGAADIVHIPYRGAGPALTDAISGHIPMITPNVTGQVIELNKTGKLRILAVTTPRVRPPRHSNWRSGGAAEHDLAETVALFAQPERPGRSSSRSRRQRARPSGPRLQEFTGGIRAARQGPSMRRFRMTRSRWSPIIKAPI